MAVDHYENFPVASLLLPRRLHLPVQNIYRFARTADDIADEGTASASERLSQLASYRKALQQIGEQSLALAPDDPISTVFSPLQDTIRQHQLPLQPFFDLLSAFEQDISVTRYASDTELMDYCRRSANPVGRLMLLLYQAETPTNLAYSDAICTGLQLTNFWQDVAIDKLKDRIYIPTDKLQHYGVSEHTIDAMIAAAHSGQHVTIDYAWTALMQTQVAQARALLLYGLPLAKNLSGRIGLELKLIVQGGLRILERLDQLHYDVFQHRPTLRKRDWLVLLWRTLA